MKCPSCGSESIAHHVVDGSASCLKCPTVWRVDDIMALRAQELLEKNNEYLERARAAERKLRANEVERAVIGEHLLRAEANMKMFDASHDVQQVDRNFIGRCVQIAMEQFEKDIADAVLAGTEASEVQSATMASMAKDFRKSADRCRKLLDLFFEQEGDPLIRLTDLDS